MSQLPSICTCDNMDMTVFRQFTDDEDDFQLQDFSPKAVPYALNPLIEYRIKLILKGTTLFMQGGTQVVNTTCVLKGNLRLKGANLSMHLIPYENLPLSFELGGYIDRNYSGRILIKSSNYSTENIRLHAGTAMGYIVMQPYSLE